MRRLAIAGAFLALLTLSSGQASAEQSKKQQQCINTLNKDFQKVASKQGKEILSCLKDGSRGRLDGTIEACITADVKGKVQKAKDKTTADGAKKCAAETPDFGAFDPNTVNEAAVQKELALVHAIFGSDLDSAITAQVDDKFESKCQQKVMSKVKKCQDTKLKVFNECKKTALRDPNVEATDLEDCIFVDPEGSVARGCIDKVAAQVRSQCTRREVDLSTAFPGIGLTDPNEVVSELDRNVECLSCLAVNQADELNRDCDDADDGVDNNDSCP